MAKNNIILISIIVLVLVAVLFGFFVAFIFAGGFSFLGYMLMPDKRGERYEFELIKSPDNLNQVSLMLVITNIVGNDHEDSYIYIIPGKYNKKEVPKDGNYIKLDNGAAIYFEWILNADNNGAGTYTLKVFSDGAPEVNNFKSDKIKIEFVEDYKMFDKFREEGTPVRGDISYLNKIEIQTNFGGGN